MSIDLQADKPDWSRDGTDWPNRDASRFREAAGLTWHLQLAGPAQGDVATAPVILLLHGTGAATHSWAGLLPMLAQRHRVIAPDLPGHGFTSTPEPARLALPAMATAVGGLLQQLGLAPDVVVGHSAGAAIGARMCLDGFIAPRLLVSLSGALLPLRGFAGKWYSPAAKWLARSGAAARYVARDARRNPQAVQRLAEGTGSRLSPRQIDWYRRLVTSPGHVGAALYMMANWDLEPLAADLPRLAPRVLLVAAGNDRTIPPAEVERVRPLLPAAHRRTLGGLGHLAHEEDPAAVCTLITDAIAELDG